MTNHVHAHAPSMLMMGVRLFASFFFVLLLFLGAVALIRYLQRRSPSLRREKRDSIEVLTSCSLAPKTTLSVVSVKGEQFLIGITPNSVNLVSRLGSGDVFSGATETPQMVKRPQVDQVETAEFPKKDDKGFDHLLKETLGRLRDGRETRESSSSNGRRWSV